MESSLSALKTKPSDQVVELLVWYSNRDSGYCNLQNSINYPLDVFPLLYFSKAKNCINVGFPSKYG